MVEIKEIVHRVKDPRIIFLLVALFFGFEYFIFGPFSYARVSDNLDAFAERAILGWRSLFAQGLIGHWQPFFAGGMDRLANMASFGEIGNLIFIFPPWLASALIIVGGIFLGGYFTFRLSHEILGLSKKASLIAGILLSLFFVTEDLTPFIFGIAIFPVVLFCLEKIFSAPHLTWLKKAAATLLIGMLYSLFSSLVLTLPFTALATVLWFLLIRKQKSPIFYLFLFLFFLPAGLFKLQEAWSLLINSPLSRRGAEAVHYKASIKQYLVLVKTLMVRNAISLPFAAAGLFIAKRKPLSTKLIFVTFFLLLVAPLYPLLAGTELGKFLGPLRNFDFSRFYLLIPFFAALAAAFFIDYFRDLQVNISSVNGTQQRRLNLQNILTLICLALVIISGISLKIKHSTSWLQIGSYQANTFSPDLAKIVPKGKNFAPFRVATLSLRSPTLYPSLPNFLGLETVDASVDITHKRIDDFFSSMTGDFSTKTSMYFLWNLGRDKLSSFSNDFDPAKLVDMNLLSLFNTRYIISDNLINSPDLKLVETPSAAAWRPWSGMSELEKIKFRIGENFTGRKLLIYENENAFPRFFLTKKVIAFESEKDLLSGLATATAPVLRENVFLVKSDAAKLPKLSGRAEKIEVVKYSNDEIRLKVGSDGPSVLVVGNGYSPFWKAYVNGEKKEIIPAYHALQAVVLEASSSEVDLVYEPPYLIGKSNNGK